MKYKQNTCVDIIPECVEKIMMTIVEQGQVYKSYKLHGHNHGSTITIRFEYGHVGYQDKGVNIITSTSLPSKSTSSSPMYSKQTGLDSQYVSYSEHAATSTPLCTPSFLSNERPCNEEIIELPLETIDQQTQTPCTETKTKQCLVKPDVRDSVTSTKHVKQCTKWTQSRITPQPQLMDQCVGTSRTLMHTIGVNVNTAESGECRESGSNTDKQLTADVEVMTSNVETTEIGTYARNIYIADSSTSTDSLREKKYSIRSKITMWPQNIRRIDTGELAKDKTIDLNIRQIFLTNALGPSYSAYVLVFSQFLMLLTVTTDINGEKQIDHLGSLIIDATTESWIPHAYSCIGHNAIELWDTKQHPVLEHLTAFAWDILYRDINSALTNPLPHYRLQKRL